MRKNFKWNSYPVWILITFSLFSCKVTNKIYETNDLVYSSKRMELKLEYNKEERKSPLISMKQSIVKKISDKETSYHVYDVLILTSYSYKLDDKVFLIIDDEVFPMSIESKEFENSREVSEKTEDIMTSDSTTMSVVTGYSEYNRKITRFSYCLPEHVISKIKSSNQILFRYYAGPDMITVQLQKRKLDKLKELINRS